MEDSESVPEGKKSASKHLLPLRTPAARNLTLARYRERNKEELAEKARIRMAKLRERVKLSPHAAQEYAARSQVADHKYRARKRDFLAWQKRLQRSEASKGKLGGRKVNERDYEAEFAIYQAKRRLECQDKIREKVVDAMWLPWHFDLSSPSTMSSSFYCIPPFHGDPGVTKETANVFYLVTSPAAKGARGIYTSWSSAQRVSERIPRGGSERFSTYKLCLPPWRACCDAGEHEHPSRLSPSASQATASAPATHLPPSLTSPSTPTHRGQEGRAAASTPSSLTKVSTRAPATSPGPSPPYTVPSSALLATYAAVRGSGVVHNSLDAALSDFQRISSSQEASLCTTESARVAALVAAGHDLEEAMALVAGSTALTNASTWALGSRVLSDECRRHRQALVAELQDALQVLTLEHEYEVSSDDEYWKD
ncbi:hypothetical protein B0H11DRAFT_1943777 [Mycena galericulata]|nr:hypothetical protein B0H11DRAFT_1943777 [Mycena galericulata]